MKLVVNRQQLAEALNKVSGVNGSKSMLPVLANVLLECKENKLMLTTTDLEIRVTTSIEALVEIDGKTTLPVKKFKDLISKLKDDNVNIESNENFHTFIKCGTTNVRLNGMSYEDFPAPVTFIPIRTFKINGNELARTISRIIYAINIEEQRKVLHGILLSVNENMFTTVATDARRLALVETVLDEYSGQEGDAILPLKSAAELKNLAKGEEVTIEIGENQAMFRCGKTIMTAKLIEGNFPNYRQIIPASFSKKVENINTDSFLAALNTAAITLPDIDGIIKLIFENEKLSFNAINSDIGEGNDYIKISYPYETMTVSFNYRYLREPLQNIDSDNITIKMNNDSSPFTIESNDGFLYIIMPIRK